MERVDKSEEAEIWSEVSQYHTFHGVKRIAYGARMRNITGQYPGALCPLVAGLVARAATMSCPRDPVTQDQQAVETSCIQCPVYDISHIYYRNHRCILTRSDGVGNMFHPDGSLHGDRPSWRDIHHTPLRWLCEKSLCVLAPLRTNYMYGFLCSIEYSKVSFHRI